MEQNPRPSRRSWKRLLLLLLLLAVLVLLLQTWHKAHRPWGYDQTSFLLASRALTHGTDPYRTESPFPFRYPLFLPLLIAPLALGPYDVAIVVWFLINLGTLVASIHLAFRLGSVHGARPPAAAAIALVVALLWPVISSNFLNGQVNFPVLLLLLLGLQASQRGHAVETAAWWAPAIAIKVAPALILLYLALRRQWRALALTLIGVAVLCALPVVFTGGRLLEFYSEYARNVLLAPVRNPSFPLEDRIYFSLPGMAVRLLGPGGAARIVSIAASLLVLATLAAAGWRTRAEAGASFRLFNLHLVAMLLLGPKSETHHLAFALPAIFTLSAASHPWTNWRDPRTALLWLSIAALALGGLWAKGPIYLAGVLGIGARILSDRDASLDRPARSRSGATESMKPRLCC